MGNLVGITSVDKEDVNSKEDITRKPLEDKHFTSSIIRQPDTDREYINFKTSCTKKVMEKYITSSCPYVLKTSDLEETAWAEYVSIIIVSGFKFLRGERENRGEKQKLSHFNKHLLGIEFVARHQARLSVTFLSLKTTFHHGKETSRCLIADSNSGSRKAISSKVLPKI